MAYTPTEWKNGDVITAEKLNKLEEGVQEANREKLVTVFDGSITTASSGNVIIGSFIPTTSIEGDSVLVTFENITYELPKVTLSFGTGYGEFDNSNNPILTNYPCAIGVNNGIYYFFTSEANTYEVEIKILQNSSNSLLEINMSRTANYGDSDYSTIPFNCDTELSVISEAVKSKQTVIAHIVEYNTSSFLTNAWTSHVSFVQGGCIIPLAILPYMGKMATLSPNPSKTNEWRINIVSND